MPLGAPELEQLEQFFLLEVLVADDVDLLDTRRQTLGDGDGDGDTVSLQR